MKNYFRIYLVRILVESFKWERVGYFILIKIEIYD